MSLPYERLVSEDFHLGHGDVDVTMPGGGIATGTKVGIHTLLPDVFNVRDFGAVGDGNSDDATSIQLAIDAAEAAEGGIVLFPPGTYKITSRLTVDTSGVSLRGCGRGTTTISVATNGLAGAITLGGVTGPTLNVGIANLTLTASITPTSGVHLLFDRTHRAFCDHVEILNAWTCAQIGTAANLEGTLLTRISDSRLDNISTSTAEGLLIYGEAGLWLTRVHFNGTQGQNTKGIYFFSTEGFDTAYLHDVLIEEHDVGIRAGSTSGSVANVFATNLVIDRARNGGIHLETAGGTVQQWLISNFFISGVTSAGTGSGIYLADGGGECRRITIRGGYFQDIRQHGIRVDADVVDLVITDNHLLTWGHQTATTYDGIIFNGTVTKFVLNGNKAGYTSGRYGINLNDAGITNGTVVGNNLTGNGTGALSNSGTPGTNFVVANNAGV